MSGYTLEATCQLPFEETVERVRAELGKVGFGVITEIDLSATLRQKVGAEIPDEVILGACNPRFAHRAITADPSVAALLPCNVVVRSLGDRTTLVEAFDPAAMMRLASGREDLADLASQVGEQLRAALERLSAGQRGTNDEKAKEND